MKRFLPLLLCLLLAGCSAGKQRVVVFAASSLTDVLTRMEAPYEAENPGVDVVFNFDSSGTLRTQIDEGAECDLFLAAGKKQVEGMDAVDFLENQVALVGEIESFHDLKARLEEGTVLLAMGNSDVPVGQYTQKILSHFGLDEAELAKTGCITYGGNVKEVLTQVTEGVVDCGVVYATDAVSAGLPIRDTATAEMCGQVIYPAVVRSQAGKDVLAFLQTEPAREIFRSVGFNPL